VHEPLAALDGGPDGVAIHRRVAAGAPDWLAPDGCLLIETSERQAPQTAAAMTAVGLMAAVCADEEMDATVVTGVKRLARKFLSPKRYKILRPNQPSPANAHRLAVARAKDEQCAGCGCRGHQATARWQTMDW
jgi:hypothetical protein